MSNYKYVHQDKKGKWYYQVFLYRDANGCQHYKKGRKDQNNKPFSGPRAAYKEALRVKNEYEQRNGKVDYKLTYKIFMENDFIPKYRADVEGSTFDSHYRLFGMAINYFGKKVINEITVRDCERYRTKLLSKTGYSQSYASATYGAFRQSLDYAVKLGLISSNTSKKTDAIGKGKSVQPYWTLKEFQKVISLISINSFYEHLIYTMFLLYYRTGLRVSEGFALTWNDINLEKKKMMVYHNLEYKNKVDYRIKAYTKTNSGKRVITLDDELVSILRNWKSDQETHGVSKFVLSYDDCPMIKSTLNNLLKKYAKLAGVKVINGRGLRHSHASFLIAEMHCDVLTVSRRLGHSSPDITLKYYSHMFPRNDEMLAEKMVGSIDLTPAKESKLYFNGNQMVSSDKAM